jgi:hypothetical protein
LRRTFRWARLPTVSPADPCSELGPRSLDPDRSFWSAFAELIRGQTSPTDFCNCTTTCGQPNRDSPILAGTVASTTFLFFTVSRPLPCGSGDTWRAALRSFVKAPVLVLLAYASLPNRDASSSAPPPKLSPRCIVRINVHGSKDRAKDASPERMRRSLVPALGACALWRMLTAFPSSASFGHPLSSARLLGAGDTAPCETDRPRSSFQRPPAKGVAFQKTRMSFTATPREGITVAERSLSPAFAPALSLTPPTLFPQAGDSAFDGHCKVTVRSPAGP